LRLDPRRRRAGKETRRSSQIQSRRHDERDGSGRVLLLENLVQQIRQPVAGQRDALALRYEADPDYVPETEEP